MIHIDTPGTSPGFSSLGNRPEQGADQAQTGLLLGHQAVLVSDEVSSLGDAAEELSLHMAETTENKQHADRKVKAERPMQLMQANEIIDLLDQCHEGDTQAKLDALVEKLLSGGTAVRQAASEAFGDVSQQYLALQYALRKGEDSGAPAHIQEAIRDALAELEIDSGPSIRAGINAIGSAGDFAADAQGVHTFQQTYRDVVLGENTLCKTLSLALERFGGKDVARGLKQLVAALGEDLAAARPSTDPRRLQVLTGDLYQLQVAITVLENGKTLAEALRAKNLANIDHDRLMRDMVQMTGEKWLSESRITAIAIQHGATVPEGRVAFVSGLKSLLRELPVQVFVDPDARQSVLGAVQDALDLAIDEEEQQ